MKTEYPPLLSEGFEDIRLDQLRPIFLDSFPSSTTRENILRKFKNWIQRVKKLNVKCEIWIDGSFATKKVNPRDIDIVVFISSTDIRDFSASKKRELEILTNERLTEEQKKECLCDSYLVFADDVYGRKYWEEKFGLIRDKQKPKGIFRIVI
ncbi:MAG: hypothetical protein FD167_3225, partial [bacterium]